MNDRDVRGVLGEMESFINRGIPSSHNSHRLVHKKRAVTRRTVRDAFADEFFFSRNAKRRETRSGSDDQRFGVQGPAVRLQHEHFAVPLDGADLCQLHLKPEAGGLLLQQRPQGIAGDAIRKSRIILDMLTVEHLSTGRKAFEQERPAAVTRRIQAGRESRPRRRQ